MKRSARKPPPKTLPPVLPNVGTEAIFRKRLDDLIEEMNNSIKYWIGATFKANADEIAMDELPSAALQRMIRKLARQWEKRFNDGAPRLAEYYTKAQHLRSKKQLEKILKDAGFQIDFKMNKKMQDIVRATMNEQVSLIKSIQKQHFTQIEGLVMRAVTKGGDLNELSKKIHHQYGVTKRRAALISRDQNNKAVAVFTRAQQLELGITEALWMHSHAGKEPRPTHLANNGKKYDVAKGWYDPDANGKGKGAWIHPGELINCRCVSRSIIPGL